MVEATVTLYKDIGLYPDYKRSMLFDSKTQQNNWFNAINSSLKKTVTANYNKIQNDFVLHEDVGNVYSYTYVRISDLDSSGRYYYGFVSDVSLVDDENTRFTIALDPIQTFMCEWSLGECLVAREHVDRWSKTSTLPIRVTSDGEAVNGYANTTIKSGMQQNTVFMGITAISDNSTYWDDSKATYVKDSPRVSFLAIPIPYDGSETRVAVRYGGLDTDKDPRAYPLPPLSDFLDGSLTSKLGIDPENVLGSWIVTLHGLTVHTGSYEGATDSLKYTTMNFFEDSALFSVKLDANKANYYPYKNNEAMPYQWSPDGIPVGTRPYAFVQKLTQEQIKQLFETERTIAFSSFYDRPVKPTTATQTYSDRYEPVLYMAPYRTRGAVSNGTPLLEVPDNVFFSDDSIGAYLSTVVSTQGVYQQLIISAADISASERQKAAIQGSTGRLDSVGVDIMSNNWLSYCLQQRESDRATVKSAIISNTITNMIGMGYGGALVGSRANSGRNDPKKGDGSNSAPIEKFGSFRKAMYSASAFGMATGLITSAVQGWDMWNQQLAKESSVRNQPNSVAVAGTGTPLIYENNSGLGFYESKIDDVNYEKARDNFRYYGYMVNRLETPNIKSRYYYNYICTLNTTIKGSLASDIKQAIATIFEKGITFFHADHCNDTEYNGYENIERSLL